VDADPGGLRGRGYFRCRFLGAAQKIFTCGCATDVSEVVFYRAGDHTGLVLVSGLYIVINMDSI
jgi:hypothetical protein